MHRDALLSCAGRPFWHFGHTWVVLAVVVFFPRWGKTFSLPVFVRLYRTEKVNKKLGLEHRKKTELANELIELLPRHGLVRGVGKTPPPLPRAVGPLVPWKEGTELR